jgi:hypothetical protein
MAVPIIDPLRPTVEHLTSGKGPDDPDEQTGT